MNPNDLLFTNQFISDKIINNKVIKNVGGGMIKSKLEDTNIKKNRENIDIFELKKYLKEELLNNNIDNKIIINNDLEENEDNFDLLNQQIRNPDITANLDRPEWVYDQRQLSLSSSVQPIFDNRYDYLKTRYRKNINSYLNVDSRHRNTKLYPNPANYNIYINKEFKYVQSIKLKSIEFREAPTPINDSNNIISWITDYTNLQGVLSQTKVKYSTIIPSSLYTLKSFIQYVEASLNSVQHKLPYNYLDGLYPNFGLYINPSSRSLSLFERLEILPINTLTTNKNSNQIQITIIYQPLTIVSPNCEDNNGFGYPFKPNFEDVPIIFTGLDLFYQEYGNIPTIGILNSVPFYTKNQVDTNPELNNKSYYVCNGNTGFFTYTLYVYDQCGNPAKASYSKIYNMNVTGTLLYHKHAHPLQVVVGRVLPVEILTDCSSTFGNYIGLLTANKSVYINTNYNQETRTVFNTIPWKNIESGQLSLSTVEYIFMRIGTIAKPYETISDNLTDANGGTMNMQLESTKDNNFFAKIMFADRDPGDISILSVGGKKIFYNAPLVSLSDLSIQFLYANGKIMNLFQNHSFTLKIVELREVLNDTLIDSRTGNIIDIGK